MPLKYMPSVHQLAAGNFSIQVEHMFDRFTRNMIIKEEMDEAFAIGRGIKY